MKYRDYVQNVVKSYLAHMNKKAIFIKHYNTLSITLDEMIEDVDRNGVYCFLFHEFNVNEMKEAYEPFLSWVKVCYDTFYIEDCSPEEFVSMCGIYSLHKDIVIGYIRDGKCYRNQEIMIEEYEFESRKMIESLYNIFKYVAKKHSLIMIISKLHMAPYSTLELINYIFGEEDGIHFIFTYNDIFYVRDANKKLWNKLIGKAENDNMILEWGQVASQQSTEFEDAFLYDSNRLEEYINKLANMYFMLTFRDAEYYLDILYESTGRDSECISDEDRIKVLALCGIVDVALGNSNQVLFACENMVPVIKKTGSIYYDYVYNYISAMAHLLAFETEFTYKFCNRCRQLAGELDSEVLSYKIDVIECIAHFNSFRKIFRCNYLYQVSEEMIEKTKRYGYEILLAYLYIFGYENDTESLKEIAEGRREPVYFNKGIEIAEKLGNNDLIMLAYMKNIIMYSERGYYKYVRQLYKKRMYATDKKNDVRRAHMYSGMGYNSIVLEEYSEADRYFRNSLTLLIKNERSEDIAEVLYNMTLNYYVAGINDKCVECMEYLLKIMNILGISGIQICNTSKIYGIMALAHYKMRQYYNSYYYLDKMQTILSHILNADEEEEIHGWEEDLYLFFVLKAVMYSYEGDWYNAEREFEHSKKYLDTLSGSQFYLYADYIMLRAGAYRREGNILDANELLEEGIKYCQNKGYIYKASQIKAMYMKTFVEYNQDFARKPIPYNEIMHTVNYEGTRIKLMNKERDINFLTICQDILVSEKNDIETVIEGCANIIQNTFNIDQILLLDRTSINKRIAYSCATVDISDKDIDKIFEFFDAYKKEFVANRIDKNFRRYYPIIEIFGRDKTAAIMGIPVIRGNGVVKAFIAVVNLHKNFAGNRYFMDVSNLQIIKVAVEQLDVAMRRINNGRMILMMNAELEKAADTDQLTGIYNRLGFQHIVEETVEQTGVILYMDIDNFKYHNDSFGHHRGDMILREFAEILSEAVGTEGYAVRYGGDEFVIFAPGKDEKYASVLSQKIIRQINNSLRQKIQNQLMGNFVIIDKDKEITCSIGIAEYEKLGSTDLDETLKHADEALYYVKKHNKGHYLSWSLLYS